MRGSPTEVLSVDEAQALFLSHLKAIERISWFACSENRLQGADAEDFISCVKLKLIENDYHVIRLWARRSSFPTYITTIIHRIAIDQLVQRHGKWRPSVAASETGGYAVLFERLIYRDRLPPSEAMRRVQSEFVEISTAELERLRATLRRRSLRPVEEPIEKSAELAVSDSAEDYLLDKERARLAGKVSSILSEELLQCSAEDRLIAKWHFCDHCKVSTIARSLKIDQMHLYRRIRRLLDRLRNALADGGISSGDARDLIVNGSEDLRVAFDEASGNGEALQVTK